MVSSSAKFNLVDYREATKNVEHRFNETGDTASILTDVWGGFSKIIQSYEEENKTPNLISDPQLQDIFWDVATRIGPIFDSAPLFDRRTSRQIIIITKNSEFEAVNTPLFKVHKVDSLVGDNGVSGADSHVIFVSAPMYTMKHSDYLKMQGNINHDHTDDNAWGNNFNETINIGSHTKGAEPLVPVINEKVLFNDKHFEFQKATFDEMYGNIFTDLGSTESPNEITKAIIKAYVDAGLVPPTVSYFTKTTNARSPAEGGRKMIFGDWNTLDNQMIRMSKRKPTNTSSESLRTVLNDAQIVDNKMIQLKSLTEGGGCHVSNNFPDLINTMFFFELNDGTTKSIRSVGKLITQDGHTRKSAEQLCEILRLLGDDIGGSKRFMDENANRSDLGKLMHKTPILALIYIVANYHHLAHNFSDFKIARYGIFENLRCCKDRLRGALVLEAGDKVNAKGFRDHGNARTNNASVLNEMIGAALLLRLGMFGMFIGYGTKNRQDELLIELSSVYRSTDRYGKIQAVVAIFDEADIKITPLEKQLAKRHAKIFRTDTISVEERNMLLDVVRFSLIVGHEICMHFYIQEITQLEENRNAATTELTKSVGIAVNQDYLDQQGASTKTIYQLSQKNPKKKPQPSRQEPKKPTEVQNEDEEDNDVPAVME